MARVKSVFTHYDVMETGKAKTNANRFRRIGACFKLPTSLTGLFKFHPANGKDSFDRTRYEERKGTNGLKFVPRYQRSGRKTT